MNTVTSKEDILKTSRKLIQQAVHSGKGCGCFIFSDAVRFTASGL